MLLFSLFFVKTTFAQREGVGGRPQIPSFKGENDNDTNLLRAIYIGDVDTARQLLNTGASANSRQAGNLLFGGESALCIAFDVTSYPNKSLLKYKELIVELLNHGADIHACPIPVHVNSPYFIDILLNRGADPNYNAPLLQAVGMWPSAPQKWASFIKSLLNAGATINVRDEGGLTVLHELSSGTGFYALTHTSLPTDADYRALVELLVTAGVPINDTISYEGDAECGPRHNLDGTWVCPVWVPQQPHCSFPMQTCPPDRMQHIDLKVTALLQATRLPQGLPLVKALLSVGADPTIRDSYGCSVLDSPGSPTIREAINSYLKVHPPQADILRSGPKCSPPPPPFKLVLSDNTQGNVTKQQTLDKLDFVCFRGGRASRTNMKNQVSPEFGGKKILALKIEDTSQQLSQAALSEITQEVLYAVGLWRRVCTKCGLANAAVVQIGSKTYVDEQLWHIAQSINDYEQFPKGGESLLSTGAPGPYTLQAIFANIRTNISLPLAKYSLVERLDPAIGRLCAADSDRVPAELQGLYASQCRANTASDLAYLQIKVLNGPTHCQGDVSAIVGCEVGGQSVELNTHEFTYAEHATNRAIFGNGKFKIDLQIVILHEIGHWAGITVHLTTENNIMSSYVEDCRCIDQAVVNQLAEPVDASTTRGNVGLLRRTTSDK